MTKRELLDAIADVPDEARVAINVKDSNFKGVRHMDIVECYAYRSKYLRNGIEVYLGTELFWIKG